MFYFFALDVLQHRFTICCLPKRKKYYELRADSEEKCDDWVAAIRGAR